MDSDNDNDNDKELGHGHAADLTWPTAVGNLHMETAVKFVNCIAKNVLTAQTKERGGEVGLAGQTRVAPAKVSAKKLTSIQCKLSRRVLIKLASKMKQKASAAA